jgi:hypothetical protein
MGLSSPPFIPTESLQNNTIQLVTQCHVGIVNVYFRKINVKIVA